MLDTALIGSGLCGLRRRAISGGRAAASRPSRRGTSCPRSNVPGKHHLSKDDVPAILRDISAAGSAFSHAADCRLLARAEAAAPGPRAPLPTTAS